MDGRIEGLHLFLKGITKNYFILIYMSGTQTGDEIPCLEKSNT